MATTSGNNSWGRMAEDYWLQSRQPLASLVFIAPLLIAYESGVALLGVQNGADAFMRRLLDSLGFSQHLLLPILVVCLLLGWHYVSRQPWRLSGGILSGMAAESILLAVVLRLILVLQAVLFVTLASPAALSIGEKFREKAGNAVGFFGAGIYEELLFRLILLSALAWGMRRAGVKPRLAVIAAAIVSSLLFAAAHHVGVHGEWPIHWFDFTFRVVAGMFFSFVFIYRGFGIAAGSHAAYDLLVGLF